MKKLKTLAFAFMGSIGLTLAATAASAELWKSEVIMSRDMTFHTPRELDLSGTAATPAVFVFNQDIDTGEELAARFRLWEYSLEQGFKALFVGKSLAQPQDGRAPNDEQLFQTMMSKSISDQFVDPNNSFVVGFGPAAGRAFRYACANPGHIRGIVAIDFEGLTEPLSCADATGLFVLSVHDGKAAIRGASGAAPARDYSEIEEVLAEIEGAGAVVQRIALQGSDDQYPDISAKFFHEKKVPLDKLSAHFIGKVMVR